MYAVFVCVGAEKEEKNCINEQGAYDKYFIIVLHSCSNQQTRFTIRGTTWPWQIRRVWTGSHISTGRPVKSDNVYTENSILLLPRDSAMFGTSVCLKWSVGVKKPRGSHKCKWNRQTSCTITKYASFFLCLTAVLFKSAVWKWFDTLNMFQKQKKLDLESQKLVVTLYFQCFS